MGGAKLNESVLRTFDVPCIRPDANMDFEDFWGVPEEVREDIVARTERVRTSTLITNHPTVTYAPRAPAPKKLPSVSAKSASLSANRQIQWV